MTGGDIIRVIRENDLEDKEIDAVEGDKIIFNAYEEYNSKGELIRWVDKSIDIWDGSVSTFNCDESENYDE